MLTEVNTETATAAIWPQAAGFVLAGGRSTRMGRDKALVQLAGRPLVAHALEVLRRAGLSASIAGARSSLAAFAPVVHDSEDSRGSEAGFGPLAGICAALASTSAQLAVFVPVDLPLLPASLIVYLLDHARMTGRPVIVPSVNGFTQTFPVVLDRTIVRELEAELAAGRRGCLSAFQAAATGSRRSITVLPIELLVQSAHVSHPAGLPPARWFLNLNSPADLRRAEANCASHRVSW